MTSLSTPTIFLTASVVANSYTFFTNLGETTRGIIPLINDSLGPIDMSSQARVKAFTYYFDRAKFAAVGGSFASAALILIASYLHPNPLIRKLTLVSGLLNLSVPPVTSALGLLSVNDELFKIDKEGTGGPRGVELTKKWMSLHRWRFICYAGAWALAFGSMVMDGRV